MDWIHLCDQLTLQIRDLCVRWLIRLTLCPRAERGQDLRSRRTSPVNIKIAVLMDVISPFSGVVVNDTSLLINNFSWETSWTFDIILPGFFISTWDNPPCVFFTWRRVQDPALVPRDGCIKISETGCDFYCSATADVDRALCTGFRSVQMSRSSLAISEIERNDKWSNLGMSKTRI